MTLAGQTDRQTIRRQSEYQQTKTRDRVNELYFSISTLGPLNRINTPLLGTQRAVDLQEMVILFSAGRCWLLLMEFRHETKCN